MAARTAISGGMAVVAGVCALLSPAFANAAPDTYVDDSAPDNLPPCSQPSPCQLIATGLADTDPGGAVHVAPGTYAGGFGLNDGKSILYDETGPAFGSIVNGNITVPGGDSGGTVSGLTLRSAVTAVTLNGPAIVDGNLFDSGDDNSTAIETTSPIPATIRNNRFTDDGIDSQSRTGVAVFDSSPQISGNVFEALTRAVDVLGGDPGIVDNEITLGHSGQPSILVRGSVTFPSAPKIFGNFIHDDDAGSPAPAVTIEQVAQPVGVTLARNRIVRVESGVTTLDSTLPVTLESDLIAVEGIGLHLNDAGATGVGQGDVIATNVTSAGANFDAINTDAHLTLDSSLVESAITTNGAATCSIAFSRGPTTSGNTCQTFQTSAPPGFVNAAGGDYHLAFSSTLWDMGNPAAPASGALDVDGDPRVTMRPGACGGGLSGRRDIGADESPYALPVPAVGCAPPGPKCNKGKRLNKKRTKCVKKRRKKKGKKRK